MFNMTYGALTSVLAALLILFCAAQIGLDGYVLHYNSQYAKYPDTFVWTNISNAVLRFHFLPYVNLTRSYTLQVATAAVGLVFGLVILGFSLRSKPVSIVGTGKRPARNVTWPTVTATLSLLLLAISLSNLVVTFYDDTHHGSSSIVMNLCLAQQLDGSSVSNCAGTPAQLFFPMTVEGWTCRLSNSYLRSSVVRSVSLNAANVVPTTCTISRIAKWWTIPLFLVPMLLSTVSFLELRRQNIAHYQPRPTKQQSFSSSVVTAASPDEDPSSPTKSELDAAEGHARSEKAGNQVFEAPEKSAHGELPAEEWRVCSELAAGKGV